ncbi:MAG: DUF1292 domain-containing protein [Clostridia bacterium]|nr:DUF1292 domain-containing protein [Clostridia bacterium]
MELIKTGEEGSLLLLSDKNGNSAYFEFVEMIVVDNTEYAVLLEDGDDMVTIMRFEEKGADGKEHYYSVDDDEIFEQVFGIFKEEFADEFDFE